MRETESHFFLKLIHCKCPLPHRTCCILNVAVLAVWVGCVVWCTMAVVWCVRVVQSVWLCGCVAIARWLCVTVGVGCVGCVAVR